MNKSMNGLASKTASLCLAALSLGTGIQAGEAKPSGDTTVYYIEGKKRVHVKGCRRLT